MARKTGATDTKPRKSRKNKHPRSDKGKLKKPKNVKKKRV